MYYKIKFIISVILKPQNTLVNYKRLKDIQASNNNPVIFELMQSGMSYPQAQSVYLKDNNLNRTIGVV